MKEEVSLLVGYGAVLGQRSMRLAALYSVMDLRASGASGVERRTFHVGVRSSGVKGGGAVDDMSVFATVVPDCRACGHSQCTDDSLTHAVT
jgi:hypothetical protein